VVTEILRDQPCCGHAWHGCLFMTTSQLADFVVLDALDRVADPYENLVKTTEREVRLVMIGGLAR
jgi:hypothetical protein